MVSLTSMWIYNIALENMYHYLEYLGSIGEFQILDFFLHDMYLVENLMLRYIYKLSGS